MRKIIRHLPNLLTSLNLLSGSLAVPLALTGNLQEAAWLILAGFLFDLSDGLVARLLNAQSALGRELDSLADVITFGLAPAALLFGLTQRLNPEAAFGLHNPTGQVLVNLVPFILPVFAGLRLARFNIDERQTHCFIGLAVPANGLMVLALPLILQDQPGSFLVPWLESGWFIPVYSVVVSFLMISPIRLYSLKIKGFSWNLNKFTYLFLILCLILLVAFQYTGLFLVVPAYLLIGSILESRFVKQ